MLPKISIINSDGKDIVISCTNGNKNSNLIQNYLYNKFIGESDLFKKDFLKELLLDKNLNTKHEIISKLGLSVKDHTNIKSDFKSVIFMCNSDWRTYQSCIKCKCRNQYKRVHSENFYLVFNEIHLYTEKLY